MGQACDGRHQCEPSYPAGPGMVWACPDCGQRFQATQVKDVKFLYAPPRVDPDTWGWQTRSVLLDAVYGEIEAAYVRDVQKRWAV